MSPDGVTITAEQRDDEILSPGALSFVAALEARFGSARRELLAARAVRQQRLDAGEMFDFLPGTAEIRESAWAVSRPAPGLVDRRVEITGPTDRKMAINALNSGAKVWMADFEDANAPFWANMVGGQRNLIDAIEGTITYSEGDRQYEVQAGEIPTIIVRPRGLHLVEKHMLVGDRPVSASLFDFGLYAFHCAQRQLAAGRGPYFYLPKLEGHLEARWWDDVFSQAETVLALAPGTVRATVLIETIPAAFEMDEILYELRHHSAGLNAGRWDYLFSIIKKHRNLGAAFVLPDRNSVTMTAPFMQAYAQLLVRTCHLRGAHAIGGMAAFVPSRRDPEVNAAALAKVNEDKVREVGMGYDGSWVAHPDLVPVCRDAFTAVLGERPNQLERQPDGPRPTAGQLLAVGSGPGQITEAGLRNDVSVALQYLAAWLEGRGAVAVLNLMEDVATAEIARSQIWQWIHAGAQLSNGKYVTADLVLSVIDEEMATIAANLADAYHPVTFAAARELLVETALADEFVEFLTLPDGARPVGLVWASCCQWGYRLPMYNQRGLNLSDCSWSLSWS
jgi:malate synthase